MRESDTATSRAKSAQETCSTACQRDLTSRRRIANLIVCVCVCLRGCRVFVGTRGTQSCTINTPALETLQVRSRP
jgi:hypothetical protein